MSNFTVQTVTLVITSNDSVNVLDSALDFSATEPGLNIQKLINFLAGVLGGAYGNIGVQATLANNTEVDFMYPVTGAVVSPTPTHSLTPSHTITPTVTVTHSPTPTPTLTVTPSHA